jgi:hypothetical protein
LVSNDDEYVASRFDLDYWGLSYRRAFEYILSHDDAEVVTIKVEGGVGKRNVLILDKAGRERVRLVGNRKNAKYVVLPGRDAFLDGHEFYSIKVHGSTIMTVYKLI